MIPARYKFYINGTEVFPHYKELTKKYSRESSQQFFRQSLNGDIKLTGFDYTIVKSTSIDMQNTFLVKKMNEKGVYEDYYTAEFNKTDCTFDDDNMIVELKTTAKDNYTQFLGNYKTSYDIIKLAPETTDINLTIRGIIQTYIVGGSSISNFGGGTYWEEDINEPIEDVEELKNTYFFSPVKKLVEVEIKAEGEMAKYNGVYTGTNLQNESLTSSTNENYYIRIGGITGSSYTLEIAIMNKETSTLELVAEEQYLSQDYGVLKTGQELIFRERNGVDIKLVVNNVSSYIIMQRIICALDEVLGVKTNDIPIDDIANINRSVFTKCVGYTEGTYVISNITSEDPTEFGRGDYGYFTNKFLPGVSGINRLLPVCKNYWKNASVWYAYDPTYNMLEEAMRKEYTVKDCYNLAHVIKALLKKIDPEIKHEFSEEYSSFLYSESNYPSIINGKRVYPFIAPKSNIIKGNYDQAAQTASLTLESILNMLRDCFRCYWFIDEQKRLRIEHVLWFMNGGSYEGITSQITLSDLVNIKAGKSYDYKTNVIEYEKDDLSSSYEFEWGDTSTDAFTTHVLNVNSSYVKKDKSESITISDFSADIDLMQASPSTVSMSGFALIGAEKKGNIYSVPIVSYTIRDVNDNEAEITAQNGLYSWHELLNYYMYDMSGKNISGSCNKDLVVHGIKKIMKQEVTFPSYDDIDIYKAIKVNSQSQLGSIGDVQINLETRQVTATLEYYPE